MSPPIPRPRGRTRTATLVRKPVPAAPGRLSAGARASRERLARLVARFPRARVLVIGDLMLDRFIRGDVRRISPEAPVPVVQVRDEGVHPGGAGNVAANLAGLGARPKVVGWVGRDAAGSELRRLLDRLGADGAGLVVARDAGTIEKTRVVAHAQQVVRLDREPPGTSEHVERALVARVMRLLPRVDAVLVSDYGKGTISRSLLRRLAERTADGGLLYLVDPKHANFDSYRGATLVKPNAVEAEAASGIAIRDDASLAAAGERLLERWETQAVLISRGEQGMALCRRGRTPCNLPTTAREVFDVTGAGDTVMSVAALALASGGSLEEAAWLANLAAGVVVGKVGTATLSQAELVHAMDLALLEGLAPPAAEPTGHAARRRTR
jgi:rfaE bifunctional protein kinase chain/domain